MPNDLLVSVIVPYVKDRGYLNQCIDSIAEQTYPNIELIDAQGDGTLPENFNAGLRRAKGTFVKMVQDDDWLPRDSIEILVNSIHSAPWVVGNVWQECEARYIWEPTRLDFKSNVEHYDIHMGSTLYTRNVLECIGGMDESLITGEEYDMHLRLLYLYGPPLYVDKEVYHYRMWAGGKSVIYRRNHKEWRKNELEKIRSRYLDKI